MADIRTFLRPFDAVSTALYAAAFRAGRQLAVQVRERCAATSHPAEAETPAPVSALPGVTVEVVEGVEGDPFAMTPENSIVVDLAAEGDDAFHEARWAEVSAAVDAGKAVVFGNLAADIGLFSVGRVAEGHYIVQVGTETPCNYADLRAAMRHGISAVEEPHHG